MKKKVKQLQTVGRSKERKKKKEKLNKMEKVVKNQQHYDKNIVTEISVNSKNI